MRKVRKINVRNTILITIHDFWSTALPTFLRSEFLWALAQE